MVLLSIVIVVKALEEQAEGYGGRGGGVLSAVC